MRGGRGAVVIVGFALLVASEESSLSTLSASCRCAMATSEKPSSSSSSSSSALCRWWRTSRRRRRRRRRCAGRVRDEAPRSDQAVASALSIAPVVATHAETHDSRGRADASGAARRRPTPTAPPSCRLRAAPRRRRPLARPPARARLRRQFVEAVKYFEEKNVSGITGDCGFMMYVLPGARPAHDGYSLVVERRDPHVPHHLYSLGGSRSSRARRRTNRCSCRRSRSCPPSPPRSGRWSRWVGVGR